MFHENFFKQKIITSVVASSGADNDKESDVTEMCTIASACEMKNDKTACSQLIANMVHFGTQITIKVLQEGQAIDLCVIYGLGIQYKDKMTRLLKLNVNFEENTLFVEDYGTFELIKAFNDVINRLLKVD